MLLQRRLPAAEEAAEGMDVDEQEEYEEYEPPSSSSRPTSSSRGRKRTGSGRAAGAAAAAAELEQGCLPPPHKAGRSGSGGDGTDGTDSANQLAPPGAMGYETCAGYDAAAMFGLGSSGDLDAEGQDMAAAAAAGGGSSRGGSQGTNASRQEKLKEKNRLAQRRFRARQKSQLEQMQARMYELSDEVGERKRASRETQGRVAAVGARQRLPN